jgi:FkbM family methyltransferase
VKSRIKLALTRSPRLYAAARRWLMVGRYLMRKPHEADFAGFRHFRSRQGQFLDIGANTGQSALSFRIFDRARPILSIEPLPQHERDLRMVKRLIPRFEYVMCAAGDVPGTETLRIPSYNGIELTGEATMSADGAGGSAWAIDQLGSDAQDELEVTEIEVEVRRLDDLGLAPALIKMDVEGFELPALRGLERTLAEHRPVLMIERSDKHEEVRGYLEGLGYATFAYDASSDTFAPLGAQAALNAFFVPSDAPDLPAGA